MSKNGNRRRAPIKGAKGNKAPFFKNSETIDSVLGKQGGSDDEMPPVFSFERMQKNSGFSVTCCRDDDRSYLIKRLFKLSEMTWRDIKQGSRNGFGTEQITREAIKASIPLKVTEDVTYFISLHYVGKKRFVGQRIGRILYILWIDYNFNLYNHGS